MNHDSPPTIKKPPVYKKWWFIAIAFLGLIYVASFATVSLIQMAFEKKLSPPVVVMYKWTDEDDVTHYSDIKPDVPAEEIPFISNTPANIFENIEVKIFLASKWIEPVSGKLLIILIAAIALVKGLVVASAYARRRKAERNAESFMAALEACVQQAADFSSALIAADIDKPHYLKNLVGLRNAMEDISNNPLALEHEYTKVIEHLQKALETYNDCLSVWNVKSQRDVTASDKKAFIKKYPNLLDKTTSADKPLPPKELRKAVRTTIWDYASRYVVQAEELFATAKSMDEQSKSDAQPEPGNTIDHK
jgi:hypothetical protein